MDLIIKNLYIQVLLAVILAIIFGILYPEAAQSMKPLGDGFIKLIKMCIAPIIFCTIVNGIIGGSDLASSRNGANKKNNSLQVGRIGLKTLIYFEILTTLALIIGLTVAYFLKPGSGMNIDPTTIDSSTISSYIQPSSNFVDFILNIIPTNIFKAFTEDNILSVLLIAIIFGVTLSSMQDRAKSIISGIDQLSQILFKIINMIMRLAPIGAFGAMSFTVGKYGALSLLPMMQLMVCFYITCILFIIIILGLVMKLCKSSIFKLIAHIKEEIFLVLSTSSSESAMPSLMEKMEKFGCKKSIIGIVIPSGYSFNLDGTCIYFTMAILFIAQAFNIDLSLHDMLSMMLVLLLTSKGAAGVTGSGFITLAATLSVIHTIPIAGLALILGIDRFMSEARAITNLIGNAVATVAISRLEKKPN